MNVTKVELIEAASAAGIDDTAAARLWSTLEEHRSHGAATFTGANVLYYFGGLLVIGAMTFFMSLAWNSSALVLCLSVFYMAGLGLLGYKLFQEPATRRPGGILVTAAVCMTPLTVYSLERILNLWAGDNPGSYSDFYSLVHQSWIFMEIATVFVGLAALKFVRFPFITMPIAFSLWYFSMDAVAFILRAPPFSPHYWEHWQIITILFGVAMLLGSIAIDRRTREDYAFWGYIYGGAALYAGLSMLVDPNDHAKLALFGGISVVIFALSVVLGRRALTVFGGLGVFTYLTTLAWSVFPNSLAFPFVLTLIGLATIGLGIWYQRNEAKVRAAIVRVLPAALREALPASRA